MIRGPVFIMILISGAKHVLYSAASDLDLHCLTMSHKKEARLIWVKKEFLAY